MLATLPVWIYFGKSDRSPFPETPILSELDDGAIAAAISPTFQCN
ncbi:hypothetical protein [Coleofasciculus sp. FACHB-1120]|nr:hypothetical protein [Coleofasciculus sp. FACHB-1120]